jgi:hypothetical protein
MEFIMHLICSFIIEKYHALIIFMIMHLIFVHLVLPVNNALSSDFSCFLVCFQGKSRKRVGKERDGEQDRRKRRKKAEV